MWTVLVLNSWYSLRAHKAKGHWKIFALWAELHSWASVKSCGGREPARRLLLIRHCMICTYISVGGWKSSYLNVPIVIPLPLIRYRITIIRILVNNASFEHTRSSPRHRRLLRRPKQSVIKRVYRTIHPLFWISPPSWKSHRLVWNDYVWMGVHQRPEETVATTRVANEKQDSPHVFIGFV